MTARLYQRASFALALWRGRVTLRQLFERRKGLENEQTTRSLQPTQPERRTLGEIRRRWNHHVDCLHRDSQPPEVNQNVVARIRILNDVTNPFILEIAIQPILA